MSDWLDDLIPKVTVPEGKSGIWFVRCVEIEDSVVARFCGRHFKPGTYTHLRRGGKLIMSDTPAERYDHVGFVQRATGDVLISGLGLGMCLGAVLKKPDVRSVTVIEKEPDVIALVGPHYCDPRVTIINANALTWKPHPHQHFDVVWHDIWDDICTDNLPQMATLNRRYATKAKWKGCWSQEQTKYYARQGR